MDFTYGLFLNYGGLTQFLLLGDSDKFNKSVGCSAFLTR